MALSEDEQRRLNDLETSTLAADPVFAASLGPAAAQRWQRRQVVFAWTASMGGLLAVFVGLGAMQGLISTGTIILSYGFLVMLWGVVTGLKIIRRTLPDPGRNPAAR